MMDVNKYFKKKTNDKMFCSVCGAKDFKSISIYENEVRGRIISIDFTLHCENDHVCRFKEYIKAVNAYWGR